MNFGFIGFGKSTLSDALVLGDFLLRLNVVVFWAV